MRTFDPNGTPDHEMRAVVDKQIYEAVQIDEPFIVKAAHGLVKAKAGDYLMRRSDGMLWACDQDVFEELYVFVEQGDAPDDITRLKQFLTDWRMRALAMNDDPDIHDELLDHIHRQDAKIEGGMAPIEPEQED